jgi:hypothetical protein
VARLLLIAIAGWLSVPSDLRIDLRIELLAMGRQSPACADHSTIR